MRKSNQLWLEDAAAADSSGPDMRLSKVFLDHVMFSAMRHSNRLLLFLNHLAPLLTNGREQNN